MQANIFVVRHIEFLEAFLTITLGSAFGDSPIEEGSTIRGGDVVTPINIVFVLAHAGLMGIPITISEARSQLALNIINLCALFIPGTL